MRWEIRLKLLFYEWFQNDVWQDEVRHTTLSEHNKHNTLLFVNTKTRRPPFLKISIRLLYRRWFNSSRTLIINTESRYYWKARWWYNVYNKYHTVLKRPPFSKISIWGFSRKCHDFFFFFLSIYLLNIE